MKEKLRYEWREFTHSISEDDGRRHIITLLNPIERICQNFDGILTYGRKYSDSMAEKQYIVGEMNGSFAFVKAEVARGNLTAGTLQTRVINVEGYEHVELLTALRAYFGGKEGSLVAEWIYEGRNFFSK